MKATLQRLQHLTLLLDAARARQRLATTDLAIARRTPRRIEATIGSTKHALKQKRQMKKKTKDQ